VDAASLQALVDRTRGELRVVVEEALEPHPSLPGHWSPAYFPGPGQGPLKLYTASLAALAETDGGPDPTTAVRRIFELARLRLREDRRSQEDLPREQDLFAAQAAFRADREAPAGWYRRGAPLGESLWAVDLDVFLEVPLSREEWERRRGDTLRLAVQGEVFEVTLPADARFDEAWSLPGCGLFELEAGVALEALEEDEEVPGHFGDLHVFPIAF